MDAADQTLARIRRWVIHKRRESSRTGHEARKREIEPLRIADSSTASFNLFLFWYLLASATSASSQSGPSCPSMFDSRAGANSVWCLKGGGWEVGGGGWAKEHTYMVAPRRGRRLRTPRQPITTENTLPTVKIISFSSARNNLRLSRGLSDPILTLQPAVPSAADVSDGTDSAPCHKPGPCWFGR